jgi:hypothetical protein
MLHQRQQPGSQLQLTTSAAHAVSTAPDAAALAAKQSIAR